MRFSDSSPFENALKLTHLPMNKLSRELEVGPVSTVTFGAKPTNQ